MKPTFFIISLFFLIATAAGAEEIVNKKEYMMEDFPVVTADPSGDVYIAYYSKDYHLNIKKLGSEETSVKQENARGSFANLSFLKDTLVLTWRPKFGNGDKFVYLQRSEDSGKTFSPPVRLNNAKDALLPISIAGDGLQRHYVVWVDERAKDFKLYMNYTLDGGRTYQDKDVLIIPDYSTVLHNILLDNDRISLIFYSKDGIYISSSDDNGAKWSEAIKIGEISRWSPSILRSVRSGNRTLVFWSGVKGLYGAYSDDMKKWHQIGFSDSVNMDINRLAVDVKGDMVFVATSWKPIFSTDEKFHVWFYKSRDGGKTWSGPVRINKNKYYTTSALYPDMHVDDKGNIAIVWQDHRLIRGNIYLNYSKDNGDTWLEKDINIEEGPGKSNSHYPFIVKAKDTYHIFWMRYANDKMIDEGFIVKKDFKLDK